MLRYESDDIVSQHFNPNQQLNLVYERGYMYLYQGAINLGKSSNQLRFDLDKIRDIRWRGLGETAQIWIELFTVIKLEMLNDQNVQKLLEKLTGKSKELFGEVPRQDTAFVMPMVRSICKGQFESPT